MICIVAESKLTPDMRVQFLTAEAQYWLALAATESVASFPARPWTNTFQFIICWGATILLVLSCSSRLVARLTCNISSLYCSSHTCTVQCDRLTASNKSETIFSPPSVHLFFTTGLVCTPDSCGCLHAWVGAHTIG